MKILRGWAITSDQSLRIDTGSVYDYMLLHCKQLCWICVIKQS